jgi:hypothetical protein
MYIFEKIVVGSVNDEMKLLKHLNMEEDLSYSIHCKFWIPLT